MLSDEAKVEKCHTALTKKQEGVECETTAALVRIESGTDMMIFDSE